MGTDNSTNTPAHPGKILREKFMDPLKITAYRLSKELGVTPITISHVLRGKRSISTSMAARLGVFFDVPGEFWLNLQARYELSHKETLLDGCPVSRCEALAGRVFHIQESPNGDPDGCLVEITSSPNGQTAAKKSKRHIPAKTASR
jgi:addiction module HigA family antidote